MKVSGFTFIKDAITYDYPIVEAIRSIIPLCDEVVVAVGQSQDDTLELIKGIDPKVVKIVQTTWDESLRESGRVLALETDKAFQHIAPDADWAFYIQGDEVIHEKYLNTIYEAMVRDKDQPKIDGLLFNYLHFYGSYDYIGASSNWYPHEIRIIKNDPSIYSYRDAQGFRKGDNQKLIVRPIDAFVYHYGWVREPQAMQRKQENFNKYWHDEVWMEKNVIKATEFDYGRQVRALQLFDGEHPAVMKERIATKNWVFDCDISFTKKTVKDQFKFFLRKNFGINIGYQNYVVKKD